MQVQLLPPRIAVGTLANCKYIIIAPSETALWRGAWECSLRRKEEEKHDLISQMPVQVRPFPLQHKEGRYRGLVQIFRGIYLFLRTEFVGVGSMAPLPANDQAVRDVADRFEHPP